VLLYVKLHAGDHYNVKKDGRAYLEPTFSSEEVPFPMQLVTTDGAHAAVQPAPRIFVHQLFPVNCQVFLLAHPYYGCRGSVSLIASPINQSIDRLINQSSD
jgi:hypothetical protein